MYLWYQAVFEIGVMYVVRKRKILLRQITYLLDTYSLLNKCFEQR